MIVIVTLHSPVHLEEAPSQHSCTAISNREPEAGSPLAALGLSRRQVYRQGGGCQRIPSGKHQGPWRQPTLHSGLGEADRLDGLPALRATAGARLQRCQCQLQSHKPEGARPAAGIRRAAARRHLLKPECMRQI
jgi:hypothetical protein